MPTATRSTLTEIETDPLPPRRLNGGIEGRAPRAPRPQLLALQQRSACPLLDDVLLETLDERDDVALFGRGHLELRQRRGGMTEEDVQSPSLMRMPRWQSNMSLPR